MYFIVSSVGFDGCAAMALMGQSKGAVDCSTEEQEFSTDLLDELLSFFVDWWGRRFLCCKLLLGTVFDCCHGVGRILPFAQLVSE